MSAVETARASLRGPGLVLVFDPPLGLEARRTLITNASASLRATVRDVDGKETVLRPGESVEGVFRLGCVSGGSNVDP